MIPVQFNMYPEKVFSGLIAGIGAVFFQNLLPLFMCVLVFEVIDFVTGCLKSYVLSHRSKKNFAFESVKAWRTIYKLVFIFLGTVLAEMLDYVISDNRLRLSNYFVGFCCGVEFWSFLENAAVISEHRVFIWLKQFMKVKVDEALDTDIDNITNEQKDGK